MLKNDVAVEGDKLVLAFKGKGGKNITRELRDPLLSRVVRKLVNVKGKRLFGLSDGNGGKRPVTSPIRGASHGPRGDPRLRSRHARSFLAEGRMRKGLNRIESALMRFLEKTAI